MTERMTFRYDGETGMITTTMSRKDFNKIARLPLAEGGAERLDEFRVGAVEYLDTLEEAERVASRIAWELAQQAGEEALAKRAKIDGGDGRA